jgi:RHS repeat-associated protein
MVQQSTNNIFENVYKFNAKELDESTGYYYYGARYYDPAISIFLSVDPLAEQFPNYNPYTYTMNNPVNLVDPTGMAPDGWRQNDKTQKIEYSPDYNASNTPEGYTYFDGGSIGNTIYNTDGTHEPMESGSENCVSCHHDYVVGTQQNKTFMSKLSDAFSNGVSLTMEGGKDSPLQFPKGSRTTEWIDVTELMIAAEVFSPETTIPGITPNGSNPLGKQGKTGKEFTPGLMDSVFPTSRKQVGYNWGVPTKLDSVKVPVLNQRQQNSLEISNGTRRSGYKLYLQDSVRINNVK